MKKKISLLTILFFAGSAVYAVDESIKIPESPKIDTLYSESAQETADRHEEEMNSLRIKQDNQLEALKQQHEKQQGKDSAVDVEGSISLEKKLQAMKSNHDSQLQLLHKQHESEIKSKEKAKAKRLASIPDDPMKFRDHVESSARSMSTAQAYDRLGLRPGATPKDIEKSLKKKIKEIQKQEDENRVEPKESAYEQAMLNKAAQKVGADAQADFNKHGQRIDKSGKVIESWGEKFDRWIQSAKRTIWGSDRATQVAVELANLNEDDREEEDRFEAALDELRYQLKRHPGQVDRIANAYLRHVTARRYNEDVIKALQESLPKNQELVREANGKPFEIKDKPSFVQDGRPAPNYDV